MAYTTVDEVLAVGPGTLLAKVDIESAYRLIPVLLQDRTLQGVKWKGAIYMDSMLPFGLRTWKEGTAIHAYIRSTTLLSSSKKKKEELQLQAVWLNQLLNR